MGRLDVPDVSRDEDTQTRRRGGITHSAYRDHVETLSLDELHDIAEARFVVAAAVEKLLGEKDRAHISANALRAFASMLRNGLRGPGR